MNKFTLCLVALLLLPFANASAETILRTGQTVSINEDRVVVGDFYTLASIANVSGRIEGDLIAAAGRFTVNGEVVEDVFAVGGSVDVYGAVGDDVRVIGSDVVIAEVIEGNVFVMGNNVTILSTASIGGDLLVYGRDVEVLGPVAGDVLGGFQALRIDSAVGGDVNISTDALILGENADIAGTLSYRSAALLERSPNAIVTGEIIRTDEASTESVREQVQDYVSAVLILAFAVLSWFLVSRKTLIRISDQVVTYSPRAAAYGLGFILLTPLVAGILLTSVLGSIVALFMILTYAIVIILALVTVPATLGQLAFKMSNQSSNVLSLAALLIGLIIIALLPLIPVFGMAIIAAMLVVSIGAIVDLGIKLIRQ